MVHVRQHKRGLGASPKLGRIVTHRVYKFEELSKEAQKKAIDDNRGINEIDSDLMSESLESWLDEELDKVKGLGEHHDVKLQYSLGYSQGDGVSFTGTFFYKQVQFRISHSGNYYHKHSTDFQILMYKDKYDGDFTDSEYEKATKIVEEFKQNYYFPICDKIEKIGYDQIEYDQSDEAVKETLIENEFEFFADGRRTPF